MQDSNALLPRWARAVDLLAIALLVLAFAVAVHGGFVFSPAGVRISVKSEWRILLWAVGLLVLRHAFVRTPNTWQWIAGGIADSARAAGPLPSDAPAAATERQETVRTRRFLHSMLAGLGVIALYAALTAVMTYPQVRQLGSGVSYDEGDALFSTWRLAWVAHQLPRDPLRLFDANIFYPNTNTLAYSDAMVVTSLMAAPLLWMGVHQIAVYNITFLAGFALSGAAMFLLVRSLTRNIPAALLAGFVFAFLPIRYMHYAHLEMQMAQWIPLCLWAVHRTFQTGRLRYGLLTGFFLALQTLSSWYYGIFLVTFLVPVGVVLLIAAGKQYFARSVRSLAAGAVLASILVIPMTVPYFAARQDVGERTLGDIEFYSATPENYLAAHPRNRLFGEVTSKWGGQERELFLGFVVPIIALIGLWPPLSAVRIAYLLAGILAFEVSLGFNGILYHWLHDYLLPYRGLRVPARMAILVGFSLAVLAGFGVAQITKWAPGRRGAIATVAVLGSLIFLEYRSTLRLRTIWTTPPPIYAELPEDPQTVVLELPLVKPDISIEPIYMYFSTFRWRQLVNGYSGFGPPSYHELVEAIASFPDDATIAELRQRGVSYVVVHEAFYPRERYARLVARLDERPELQKVATMPWQQHETRLYRFVEGSVAR